MEDNCRDVKICRIERVLEVPMLVLTVVFVGAVVAPLHPAVGESGRIIAEKVEMAIWAAFALEYISLLALASDRRAFVRTHLVDLLIVLVPAFRAFRLLRLLRIVRLAVAASGFARSFAALRRVFGQYRLGYVAVTALVILVGVSGLMLVFEGATNPNLATYPKCLWWAVVTMTTVGYGDAAPTTAVGRALACAFMLIGIGLLGVITATIASVFVGIERRDEDALVEGKLNQLSEQLSELRDELRALHTQSVGSSQAPAAENSRPDDV
jgi:voltage-gated potassium channel